MKKIIISFLVAHISNLIYAQFYDANWVVGDVPNSNMYIRGATVSIDSISSRLLFGLTMACISDENGNLLYFTNGISINDTSGILINGDSLNPCSYTSSHVYTGLNIQQAALFIPGPGNSRYYYLFHFSDDDTVDGGPGTLFYSLVDKQQNNNRGEVIKKNITLVTDVKFREGGLTACKHANGRDYWIILGQHNSNNYFKFLLTPDSIFGPFTQAIGPVYTGSFDLPYSKFSQDGSKYATGAVEGLVLVMDFDRCSGEFSNPITIFNQACTSSQPCSGCVALEFSPNNRFLYVSNVFNMNQYDLQSPNIQDSSQVYLADSLDAAGIDMLQLGSNGKLYASTWDGGFYFYHVVNEPDSIGDSCHFVWGGQPTYSANSNAVSNLINYKLGPLIGSGCDTIAAIAQPESNSILLRVMPNPADKYLYVEMGIQGSYEFNLLNVLGQIIATRETKQVDIFDTEILASGMYFLNVINRITHKDLGTSKIIISH
jgi:hypothetical protein